VFDATAFAELNDILLHKLLKVVPTARPMYRVDALRVVYILNQILQLAGRIPWQPREARLFPETGQKVQVIAIPVFATAGTNWPHGVSRHDMDEGESG